MSDLEIDSYHPLAKQKYIHLLKQDVPVWERFLSSDKNIYTSFSYDVRVGDGRDPGQNFDQPMRAMAIGLSQRRIDAVGHAPDHLAIIEITRSAGTTALGQIHVYAQLFKDKYPTHPPIKKIIVAEEIQTDCNSSFLRSDVTVYLFPPT